ncbi:hypothetical protein BsWGS_04232 [Bradybaena similaris]
MNSEVRRAIKKRWNRFLDSRTMQNSVSRRRSSRTSMTTFVSNPQQCNGLDATVVEMHPLKPPDGNGHTVSL